MTQQAHKDEILNTLLETYDTKEAWVDMMTKMKEIHINRRDLEQDYDSDSNLPRNQIKAINSMNEALDKIVRLSRLSIQMPSVSQH